MGWFRLFPSLDPCCSSTNSVYVGKKIDTTARRGVRSPSSHYLISEDNNPPETRSKNRALHLQWQRGCWERRVRLCIISNALRIQTHHPCKAPWEATAMAMSKVRERNRRVSSENDHCKPFSSLWIRAWFRISAVSIFLNLFSFCVYSPF